MNEAQRVAYLEQLGVVSWMPRQPLPGALASEYFVCEESIPPVEGEAAVMSAVAALDSSAALGGIQGAVQSQSHTGMVGQATSPVDSFLSGDASTKVNRPAIFDGASSEQVAPAPVIVDSSRVPDQLRLGLIRTADQGPLLICNITGQDWPEHKVMPMVGQMLHFMQQPASQICLPFEWPFPGSSAKCSEQEFLAVLKALLSGARLQCQPGQRCWWFGELPELIQQGGLLQIELHYPLSLVQLLEQPEAKAQLLQQLLTIKAPTEQQEANQ